MMLTIRISSFSYKKGIPADPTGNGGGFVFDCRGIHNPGRYDAYKSLNGKDQQVIDFFMQKTKIDSFINDVFSVVKYNIENYIKRDFESLIINFGCTGGQHRSVYCAENIAKKIKNKYPVNIIVSHVEQGDI